MAVNSESCADGVLRTDETLDELRCGGLQLIQHCRGYRFSLDPVLLANFATVAPRDRVLDMGCGCGVIALLLGRREPTLNIIGVEIQAEQVDRARRSVVLNRMHAAVRIEAGDVRTWGAEYAGTFDRVVCNPPFRACASGRISSGSERSCSRHEMYGALPDFVHSAARFLRHKGTLSMVHLAERLTDILAALRSADLEPKRLRMVQSRVGEEARLILVEARRGGRPGLQVEAPLFVYAADGSDANTVGAENPQRNYSAEVSSYYDNC